jgi:CBS domain-containing protein
MRWTPMLKHMAPSEADRIAIADAMARDVACVTRDVSIESLTALMRDRHCSAAPVVDGNGYPIGMVSKTDLVRERWADDDTVADIMTPLAFTLDEDDPLSHAAAVMAAERVHHLPIVASDGRVVGILSSFDVVRWVAGQSGYATVV